MFFIRHHAVALRLWTWNSNWSALGCEFNWANQFILCWIFGTFGYPSLSRCFPLQLFARCIDEHFVRNLRKQGPPVVGRGENRAKVCWLHFRIAFLNFFLLLQKAVDIEECHYRQIKYTTRENGSVSFGSYYTR